MRLRSLALACCSLAALSVPAIAGAPYAQAATRHTSSAATQQTATPAQPEPDDMILAVINSIPLTKRDVDNRGKLFALSTGLPLTPDLMARLRPQIIRQLIDERLRTQEILSRHINVPPEQIAGAITNIERRNGMPEGTLREHLAQDGVSLTTLIDQHAMQRKA